MIQKGNFLIRSPHEIRSNYISPFSAENPQVHLAEKNEMKPEKKKKNQHKGRGRVNYVSSRRHRRK